MLRSALYLGRPTPLDLTAVLATAALLGGMSNGGLDSLWYLRPNVRKWKGSFLLPSFRLCRIVTARREGKGRAFVTHLGLLALPSLPAAYPVLSNQHSLSLLHPSVRRPRPSIPLRSTQSQRRCSRAPRPSLTALGNGGQCIIFSFRAAPLLPFPSLRRRSSAIDRRGRWTFLLRSI